MYVAGYTNTTRVGICTFTGKERDAESGLDYFGARYYGSALGRFTSPDWSASPQPVPYADLNNPQSLNLYMYLGDNPLARIDPNGHADGPCKTGTPGCTNGVQQSSTGAPLAFDKNDKRNQKAADANPAFLAPEKNGQTGGKGGGEIAYKLNRSPGDTTHYTVIQAESNAGRVTAVSDFGGNVSLGPRDNHFIDSIDTGADPLQGRSNSVQTFFMVPLDKNGNYAGPPQPVNVKDSQGNVFNSLGVYFTGPGGQAFVNSHVVTDPSFLPPSSQGTNQ